MDFRRLEKEITSEQVAALDARRAEAELSVVDDLNAYSEICYNEVAESLGCGPG